MANTHSLDLELSSSQYAYIADASQTGLDLSGDFTIEGWIKLESAPGTNVVYYIAGKYSYSDNKRSYLFNYRDQAGTKRFTTTISSNGSTTDTVVFDYTLTTGVWYHVALVCDISNAASTEFEMYINGESIGNGTVTGDGSVSSLYNNDVPFSLGAIVNNGNGEGFFDGKLDNMRVWSDIRTASEIESSFHKETPADTTNLVGHWKLNNDYTDSSGNGNTLTASGSPVFATDPAFTEEETYSLDLELSSSQYAYINDADQTGLDLSGDFTFEFWIKHESLPSSGNYSALITKDDLTNRSYVLYIYNNAGNYELGIIIFQNGSTYDQVNIPLGTYITNTWYHLAITCDISNAAATEFEAFKNGSSLGNGSVKNNGSVTSIADSSAPFLIGRNQNGSAFHDGLIDEVRVWSVVRTGTQIANAMNDIIDPDTTGLQGYWRFENNFADLTDNNNWLTPSGSPVFSTDVPFVPTTNTGNFLNFFY